MSTICKPLSVCSMALEWHLQEIMLSTETLTKSVTISLFTGEDLPIYRKTNQFSVMVEILQLEFSKSKKLNI